jgi:hypothetical protein
MGGSMASAAEAVLRSRERIMGALTHKRVGTASIQTPPICKSVTVDPKFFWEPALFP